MEKENIRILLNTDLEKLLQYTGQYGDFVCGKLRCEHCGRTISIDNIGLVKPMQDKKVRLVKFWCDNIDCITSDTKNDGR